MSRLFGTETVRPGVDEFLFSSTHSRRKYIWSTHSRRNPLLFRKFGLPFAALYQYHSLSIIFCGFLKPWGCGRPAVCPAAAPAGPEVQVKRGSMTPTQQSRQQKKLFLEKYHDLMLRARCKRLMVEQLRSDYSSVRGVDYSSTGIPRGRGHTSDLSGMYARIDTHQRELDATLQRTEHIFRLVKRELDALNDQRGAYVLSLRHFRRLSWKEIAAEMNLASSSRTREIYDAALDRFEIPAEFIEFGKGNENEQKTT